MQRVYRICVEVPESADIDGLFTAIADAAHDWEPEERDGWDVEVHGSVVDDPDDDVYHMREW